MSDRALTPPRFTPKYSVVHQCWRVWDQDNSCFMAGSFMTKRYAEKRCDKLNAREIKAKLKAKVGLLKTRLKKLRNLNYAGDPAPIRQYKD